MHFINNNTGVSNIVTTSVPIINTIPNNNLKINKAITSGKCKKSPIIISNIKKIESTLAATKPVVTQLTGSSQPVQILLTRKLGGGLNTNINTNNQHNQLNSSLVTSTKPKGVIHKRTMEEKEEKLSEQTLESINCTTVNTEEIMKKFRIPKGIALTPKFANNITVSRHIPTTTIPHISTALISSACTSTDDVDNTSALVEYVEEIYDDEEETEVINAEEIESCEYQEYDETDIQNAEELEESDLIEEIESSDQQDLILSGDAEDYAGGALSNNSEILIATTRSQQPTTDSLTNSVTPQIIQVAQSNGTIACFQLPPNTILLQSPDGTLLATTAPHPSKPGQQQVIAVQDLSSLSDFLNIPANDSTTVSSSTITPTNAALIINSEGPNLPVVATTSVNSTATSNIANKNSNEVVITSNESLVKAQQQQILA